MYKKYFGISAAVLSIKNGFYVVLLMALVSCGGSGSNDTTDTTTAEEETPTVLEAKVSSRFPGDGQFTVMWTHELESNEDNNSVNIQYDFYYAEEQIEIDRDDEGNTKEEDLTLANLTARFSGLKSAVKLEDVKTPLTIDGLTNDTVYYFVIVTTTDDDSSDPTDEQRMTPRSYDSTDVQVITLNDTGVQNCADYAYSIDKNGDGDIEDDEDKVNSGNHNNDIDCLNGDLDTDEDTTPDQDQQDAGNGRDYLASKGELTKIGSGQAGFDFTKLDASGNSLAVDATEWRCVKDNNTNLIWEVKTQEGLHNAQDRYTWYSTDIKNNGDFSGYQLVTDFASAFSDEICFGFEMGAEATYCNTQTFSERVNTAGLCGFSDWRIPKRQELLSLVNFAIANPNQDEFIHNASIDTDFFPNTQFSSLDSQARYWSSNAAASSVASSWAIYFGAGGSIPVNKGSREAVRLVRKAN